MADDNSKSTNGLYRVEREWTVGRLAPALLLVSSMRPASNPSALVAFAGKMHPPRPLLCDDTLLVSSLHVTYTAGCVVVLFFFSLSLSSFLFALFEIISLAKEQFNNKGWRSILILSFSSIEICSSWESWKEGDMRVTTIFSKVYKLLKRGKRWKVELIGEGGWMEIDRMVFERMF